MVFIAFYLYHTHTCFFSDCIFNCLCCLFTLLFNKKNIDSKNQNGSAKKSDEIHVENKVRRASKL